jgi:hypothetical protein
MSGVINGTRSFVENTMWTIILTNDCGILFVTFGDGFGFYTIFLGFHPRLYRSVAVGDKKDLCGVNTAFQAFWTRLQSSNARTQSTFALAQRTNAFAQKTDAPPQKTDALAQKINALAQKSNALAQKTSAPAKIRKNGGTWQNAGTFVGKSADITVTRLPPANPSKSRSASSSAARTQTTAT